MIDYSSILRAIGERLIAAETLTRIMFPGDSLMPEKPFLIVEVLTGRTSDQTIGRASPSWSGTLVLTVVADASDSFKEGTDKALSLGGLFPAALRLPLSGGGELVFPDHPSQLAPYEDTDGSSRRFQMSANMRSE